jgi:acyl-CoA reductase-like NAD-dependent aldehyde dehydrogenase
MLELQMTIDGRQLGARESFNVHDPATGQVVGRVPNAGLAELDAAVAAAKAAFRTWSRLPDAQRQAALSRVSDLLEAESDVLARLVTQEQGKPLAGAGSRFEAGAAVAWARHTAAQQLPVKLLQDNAQGRVELHRRPIGVVGSITPWNWPLMIAIWHILPALRAGNTVVIKPSPFTPLATLRAVQVMNQALPPGVLNIVTSDDQGENLGAAMSRHPDIGKIVFTGSNATGERVMAGASATMKRLTLELGGNDAGIVLPDANPQAIAEGLFWGAFVNAGQTCAALKRLYVHDSLHDAVCESLATFARNVPMGHGLQDGMLLGPLTTSAQHEKVARLAAAGRAEGRVLLGGDSLGGQFFSTTLISDLSPTNPLVTEEQFGPVLPILRYARIEDAIEMANNAEVGLGGSVWGSDIAQAREVALQLECGSVWINKHGAIQPDAPFGGLKKSGLGVEFGDEGLYQNTDIQVVFQ